MNFGAIIKFYENHKKIIKWFILIFFALFTAFLYLLYYLCLFHNLKNMGEPIYPLRTEGSLGIQSELTMFAIRVREIIDGYWHVADPGFYEYRYFPVRLNEMLPPAVYYFIYLFTGLKYLFAIGDSLLIFASFILIFFLIYLLTQRYYIGLFFTFMFLMVKDFLFLVFPGLRPISNINQFKELIKAFSPFVFQDWEMPRRADFVVSLSTRPGILFFAPTLIFLFLFVKDKKNIYAAMLGICYGLLFYTYPFYWMYMTIVFGLLGAVYLWRKNFSQFKKLIFSGAIAWAISVLYWLNQIKLRILPQFQDIKNHAFVIVYGGNFQWSYYFWYLFCATLALLIYFYAKKKDKMHIAYYLIPLLAAGFVGFNMQVITGFNFSSSNWWTRVGFVPIFLAIAVLFSWFFEYLEEKHKIWRSVVTVFTTALIVFQITGSVQGQTVKAEARAGEYIFPKGVGESLIWIDKNLPKDSVILALNPEINYSLLIYTSARTFIQYPYNDIVSQKERSERIYVVYKFFQVAPEVFEKKFKELSFLYLYGQTLKGVACGEESKDPRKIIVEDIISGYRNYKFDLAQVLAKYKIDYIYYEPADKALTNADFNKFDYLEKIYSNDGGVKIYKLVPEKIKPSKN